MKGMFITVEGFNVLFHNEPLEARIYTDQGLLVQDLTYLRFTMGQDFDMQVVSVHVQGSCILLGLKPRRCQQVFE